MAAARRVWVRAALILAGVGALFVLARVGTHLWAVRRAAEWRREVEGDRTAVQARLAWRLPPTAEDPANEAACDTQGILRAMMGGMGPRTSVSGAKRELPVLLSDPLDDGWLDALAHGGEAREGLHLALRCTRSRGAPWEGAPYSMSEEARRQLLGETWMRARQLHDGHPGRPAAESAFTLVRLSFLREVDGENTLPQAASALLALARVLAARAAGISASDVASRLDALEPSIPSVASQVATRRRQLAEEGQASLAPFEWVLDSPLPTEDKAKLAAGRLLFPAAALQLMAVLRADGLLQEVAPVVQADDAQGCAAFERSGLQYRDETWNVAARDVFVGCRQWLMGRRELRAGFALARAAVTVEEARLGDGLYPERLPDDARLRDPYSGGSLRYAPTVARRAYRMWSVGDDGGDGSGFSDDLLVVAPEIPAQ